MTTGHIFIAQSLDGYIARPDHSLDWLMKQTTEGEDHGYDDFIATVDGIVMGRGSFLNALTFDTWPYDIPVIVLSKTLRDKDVPAALTDKVILSQLPPRDLMGMLADLGWQRAYIDGGKVVQSFLREGLINDIILTQIPILIGRGIRLFGDLNQDIDMKHLGTKSFASGLVTSFYKLRA